MEALAGEYIRNYLHVKRFPRISLVCKLVPVQYREYEYGLLFDIRFPHKHCYFEPVCLLVKMASKNRDKAY